jgi:hypothetical protein
MIERIEQANQSSPEDIQNTEYLDIAVDLLKNDLPDLVDYYVRFDLNSQTLSEEETLEKAQINLDKLHEELSQEIETHVSRDPRNGWTPDKKARIVDSSNPKNYYIVTNNIYYEPNFIKETTKPFFYKRYSNFYINVSDSQTTLNRDTEYDKGGISIKENVQMEVLPNDALLYIVFSATNAEKRIEKTLESVYQDTLHLPDTVKKIWLFSINGIKDDTYGLMDTFVRSHPEVFARFLEISKKESQKIEEPYARRTLSANIAYHEMLGIQAFLQPENAYIASFDDDITIPRREDGQSVCAVLMDELENNPHLKAISPSLQPEQMEKHIHPKFFYYSNIQKEFLSEAPPKPHVYGGFFVRKLDEKNPVTAPALHGFYEDSYLRYYYSNETIENEVPIFSSWEFYPTRTTPHAVFQHPEDHTLSEYIRRKRAADTTITESANLVFGENRRSEIDNGMRTLLLIHREGVNRALVARFGVTSKEFLGGKLFEQYLVSAAVNPLYSA